MRLRRYVARALLVLVSSLVSLAMVEIAFRAYESRYLLVEVPVGRDTYDLGELGYNDGRIDASRGPGEFRILSFGDSFTWSIVTFPHSWNGVLERALTSDDRTARVVNLGVADRTFDSYVDQARFWSGQLEHDAVIFLVYVGNDFSDAIGTRRIHRVLEGDESVDRFTKGASASNETAYLVTGPGSRVPRLFASRMLDYASAIYWTWRTGAAGPPELLDTTQLDFDRYTVAMSVASHPYWDRALSRHWVSTGYAEAIELLRLADELGRSGRQVSIVLAPPAFFFQSDVRDAIRTLGVDVDALDPGLPATTLATLAQREGLDVEIIDLSDCLSTHPDAGSLYYGTNTHWGLEGNRAVGGLLAARLRVAWLGEHAVETDDECRLDRVEPAPPGSPRARYAQWMHEAARVEQTAESIVEAARGRRFASRDVFEAWISDFGLRRAGTGIEGGVLSGTEREEASEEPPTLLTGWISDAEGGDLPAVVLALHRGRLVGWASTIGPSPWPRPDDPPNPAEFRLAVLSTCREIDADPSVWLYGIGASGRFAALAASSPIRCDPR